MVYFLSRCYVVFTNTPGLGPTSSHPPACILEYHKLLGQTAEDSDKRQTHTMPSRRSRSRSRSPRRSRSPERDLPNNASPISESDYFQKSSEFRIWLKDEKGKVSPLHVVSSP